MRRLQVIAAALVAVAAGVIGVAAGMLLDGGGERTDASSVAAPAVAAPANPVAGRALSVAEVYRLAEPSVVEITVSAGGGASFRFGDGEQGASQGSGWVYDEAGHVITNEHVVEGARTARVRFADGSTARAEVVGTDASTDLAVLKVDAPASKLDPLALADSSQLSVGDGVLAIGSPFGLEGTVTSGIVSALHREITAPNEFTIDDAIQTDAALNHGNSGGPLLDLLGRVVGVNAQIRSESGGNEGVGFAIPSNTVRRVAKELIADGEVEHAYLGVSLDPDGRARIASVRPATPADEAELQVGDVVVALDGDEIATGSELRSAIDRHAPGDEVELTVRRGGRDVRVTVTLANRPS